jgi:metallopeptidase MepB
MLFHELGHGIHDLVSKTEYARFHGTNTVHDFCEAPSQMLENWCWTHSTLRSLSQHYSTLSPEYSKTWQEEQANCNDALHTVPDKIPEDMLLSLIKTKKVNNALYYLGSLHVSIFDMTIHGPESHEAAKNIETSYLWNSLRKEILKIDGPEVHGQDYRWGHGQVTFGHLIVEDYDAGYYGYLRYILLLTD